jgi:hypothetical protein
MIPLAAIIESAGVELRPAGPGRLRGLCPFHSERTPSFFVFEDREKFHCYGCGEHGDGIDFVRRTRNCSYREALTILGVESPRATAQMKAEILAKRAEKAKAEWREIEVARTIGVAIRLCNEALKDITPETLDDHALILQELSTLQYQHDTMIYGDQAARAAVVQDYSSFQLIHRGLLWKRDFDYRAWLRGVNTGMPIYGKTTAMRMRGAGCVA